MKKTKKGPAPSKLLEFKQTSPTGSWDDFRNDNRGLSYKELREQVADDQGGLCAYCETHHRDQLHTFSIEHFHPKSDISDPSINWALDWQNMLVVCRGGREEDKSIYPTPENLSCDANKDHVKLQSAILNPLDITSAKIFDFKKRTGELLVSKNIEKSLETLAEETLRVLNLNCCRLCAARLEVLKSYNQLIAKARRQNNTNIFQEITERWLSKTWLSYFTTRRCLLGGAAEKYLVNISFDG